MELRSQLGGGEQRLDEPEGVPDLGQASTDGEIDACEAIIKGWQEVYLTIDRVPEPQNIISLGKRSRVTQPRS